MTVVSLVWQFAATSRRLCFATDPRLRSRRRVTSASLGRISFNRPCKVALTLTQQEYKYDVAARNRLFSKFLP